MHPTPRSFPSRRLAGALLFATVLALPACGSDDEETASDSTSDTTAEASPDSEATTDDGSEGTTDDGSEGTTDTSAADASAVDVCEAIPAADIQEILVGAEPITAVPNEVIPTANCDYQIEIGSDAMTMDAAVVQIQLAGDAAYYDAQRDLQADAVDLAELESGFAFNSGGTIFLTTDAGTWTVIRGVEIDSEATTQATEEQMVAIAQLVEERL